MAAFPADRAAGVPAVRRRSQFDRLDAARGRSRAPARLRRRRVPARTRAGIRRPPRCDHVGVGACGVPAAPAAGEAVRRRTAGAGRGRGACRASARRAGSEPGAARRRGAARELAARRRTRPGFRQRAPAGTLGARPPQRRRVRRARVRVDQLRLQHRCAGADAAARAPARARRPHPAADAPALAARRGARNLRRPRPAPCADRSAAPGGCSRPPGPLPPTSPRSAG